MLLAPRDSTIRMSSYTPKTGHHTEDWSRSSFFDFNSEMVKNLDLESDNGGSDNEQNEQNEHNESALDPTFYSLNDTDINTQEISDNPFMNEILQSMVDRFATLIETGELPPTFMDKMKDNPEEIVAFVQENHTTIGHELTDKLDPETRPTLHHMVESGYIPNEYFPFIQVEVNDDEETKNDEEIKSDQESEQEAHSNEDDIKTEQIANNSDGEKSKGSDDITSSSTTEAAYIEELKSLNENKDKKIQELMAEVAALKEREKKNLDNKSLQRFSISRTQISVENEIRLKHKGEIEAVKNQYNKLLDDIKRKNKELERKHLDSITALQDAEESKLELLKIFNGEIDRMREEIKKYNSIRYRSSKRVNV